MTEPRSVSLDDLEQVEDTQQPSLDLSKPLDGEGVPEEIKGKSVADLFAEAKRLSEALRMSEQARLSAVAPAPVAATPPPAEPKELTDEEIRAIYDEDPLKAVEIKQAQLLRKMEKQYEARLAPLFAGSETSAEQNARQKYQDEFALFGDEIKTVIDNIPNRAILSQPGTWDDIISYIRGKSGNFEKLADARYEKQRQNAVGAARQVQEGLTGFQVRPGPSEISTGKVSAANLDKTQLEIAEKLGMSVEDYVKWSNVG